MRRYNIDLLGNEYESSIGDFVFFTDAQADKHAALKELAAETLPYLELLFKLGDGEDNEKDRAILAKLKSLTEGPV